MRWLEKLRVVAVSYWTAGAALIVISVWHWLWFRQSGHKGEAVSGYGAALVMLGVFVASRPYIRTGFAQMVADNLPKYDGMSFSTDERLQEYKELVDRERPRVKLDIWAERIVAVAVVLIGTLLNGYGTPLARWWGWPV